MNDPKSAPPWASGLWRRLLFPVLLGAAVLLIFYIVNEYRFAARDVRHAALWDLVENAISVGLSALIAFWVWRTRSWSRAFRYLLIWMILAGSVVATICIPLADLRAVNGGALAWVLIVGSFMSITVWIVGFWIAVILKMRLALRRDRKRRSHPQPGASRA